MAQPFSEFYSKYIGTAHDVDGSYGAQCWDGYAFYDQWLGYSPIYCSASGGARDLWEQRSSNGILNNHDIVSGAYQDGDIGVWGASYGDGYGHVAMYYKGQWMGQNQGGTPYPSGGAAYNLISMAAPMGAFRPKCYSVKKEMRPRITCKNGLITNIEWVEVEI